MKYEQILLEYMYSCSSRIHVLNYLVSLDYDPLTQVTSAVARNNTGKLFRFELNTKFNQVKVLCLNNHIVPEVYQDYRFQTLEESCNVYKECLRAIAIGQIFNKGAVNEQKVGKPNLNQSVRDQMRQENLKASSKTSYATIRFVVQTPGFDGNSRGFMEINGEFADYGYFFTGRHMYFRPTDVYKSPYVSDKQNFGCTFEIPEEYYGQGEITLTYDLAKYWTNKNYQGSGRDNLYYRPTNSAFRNSEPFINR